MSSRLDHARRRTAKWLASCALLVGTHAFASFGAHYLGTGQDRGEYRFYLDGGEYLATTASFQSIRVTVHLTRPGRPVRVLHGCVYVYDPGDPRKNRIECAVRPHSPLSGTVYERETGRDPARAGAQSMVCVRRCGLQAPKRLELEAEEDNH